MPQLRLDISLGNILTILTMVIAAALGWQQLASALELHATRIDKLEMRIGVVSAETQALAKTRSDDKLEVTSVLVELRTDIRYMRAQLDALTRLVPPSRMDGSSLGPKESPR